MQVKESTLVLIACYQRAHRTRDPGGWFVESIGGKSVGMKTLDRSSQINHQPQHCQGPRTQGPRVQQSAPCLAPSAIYSQTISRAKSPYWQWPTFPHVFWRCPTLMRRVISPRQMPVKRWPRLLILRNISSVIVLRCLRRYRRNWLTPMTITAAARSSKHGLVISGKNLTVLNRVKDRPDSVLSYKNS